MGEFFDKIVKYFNKLDDYAILSQKKEHLIVGLTVEFTEYNDKTANPFILKSEYTSIRPRELNSFFLITIAERATPLDRLFLDSKWPLLSLNNKKGTGSLKEFKELLDNFVKNNFYS